MNERRINLDGSGPQTIREYNDMLKASPEIKEQTSNQEHEKDKRMKIIDINMQENDGDAKIIGEYLINLSEAVWYEGESFSGKRPFGNSGWQYEIYEALIRAEFLKGTIDEDDCIDDFNEKQAEKLIKQAFKELRELLKIR